MDKKSQLDKRLEPFVGNDPNHIGYSKSFKSAKYMMSTEELEKRMKQFTKEIQNTVKHFKEANENETT